MSAIGNSINYDTLTRGYIFSSLWKGIDYKEEMKNFIDLQNFFVCYVRQAYVDNKSCVITNETDEAIFYMENGKVKLPLGREQEYESYLQLMEEG